MAGNQQSGDRGSSGRRARGFAAMDAEQQRRIARKGGKASASRQQRDEQGQFAGSKGDRARTTSSGAPASGGSGAQRGGSRGQGGAGSGAPSARGGTERRTR